MKSVLFLLVAGMLVLFIAPSELSAQEWKKAEPGMLSVLVDTNLIRAVVVTFDPGQKSGMHTHPAHFLYALSDCKLMVRFEDGAEELYDLKAGESGYSGPERPHTAENIGEEPAKFLLIELKEHPYKAPKKKGK